MRILSLALATGLALTLPGEASAPTTLRVYFIGNSLTMSSTLDRVFKLFAQRDIDLQFGSQLSAGKSLIRHLNYEEESNQKWKCWETMVPHEGSFLPHPNFYVVKDEDLRFGRYEEALSEHTWDAVVLQLYESNLHDDLIAIPAFIDRIVAANPDTRITLYSTWPRRMRKKDPEGKPTKEAANLDYAGAWLSDYTAAEEDTSWKAGWNYASRDYVDTLMTALDQRYPDLRHPIRLIPVGEIVYTIDAKVRSGALPRLADLAERQPDLLPGLDDDTSFEHGANVLYADLIHFNPIPHRSDSLGIFIVGQSLFAGLSGQSPVGLSGEPYGLDDDLDRDLIRSIQSTIQSVFEADPRTTR